MRFAFESWSKLEQPLLLHTQTPPRLKQASMAATVLPSGQLRPEYNQQSVQRFAGSSPINIRMLLINSLLVTGCIFVMISSLESYNTALGDFERISRVVAVGDQNTTRPCGLAVPRTLYIMQSLKHVASDPFVEPTEGPDVTRVRNSFCGTASITDALRIALLTSVIPESSSDGSVDDTTENEAAVKSYLCACDSESVGMCSQVQDRRGRYGDILRRITHAYILAAPAFATYIDTNPGVGGFTTCTRNKDPWSADSCPSAATVRGQLEEAAKNTMHVLSGADPGNDADAVLPSYATMLYRLLALSVVEHTDRTSNGGQCFANFNNKDPIAFCDSILTPSKAIVNGDRPFGVVLTSGSDNATNQLYYEQVLSSSTCGWDSNVEPSNTAPAEPSRRDRKFGEAYEIANPVLAVCASQLEFGLMDQVRLLGLIDPISEFEHFNPYFNNSFTNFLASWGYGGLYEHHVEKASLLKTHTPYNMLKLFVAYRYAMTSAWTMAAIIACGYLLAYAALPLIKLFYVRLIRRSVTSSKTGTIVVKPAGAPEYVSLGTIILVGLWIIFVDPAANTPYPITTSCDNYLKTGGPFETTARRAPKGLIGLILIIMGAGLLTFVLLCRRKPRKKRILPLKPFKLWPMYVIIIAALGSIFVLAMIAGNDWAKESLTDQTGTDSSLAHDLDALVTAGIWSLMMLALLTGVLNQRSMAANAAIEVPFGGQSVFALLWAGLGLTTAVLAAVFSWPLFDCTDVFSSNKLTCGDGTRIDVRWNRFWGCAVWGLCVASILLVFWASYRVLTALPKKASGNPFAATRDAIVNRFSSSKTAPAASVPTPPAPLSRQNASSRLVGSLLTEAFDAPVTRASARMKYLPVTSNGVVPAATVVIPDEKMPLFQHPRLIS